MKRYGVHKGRSAGQFKRHAGKTKKLNLGMPMRGGIRL